MAGFFDFLFGSSDKLKQVPTMNPQQNQLLMQLLGQLGMGGGQGQGQPGSVGGNYQGAQDWLSQLLQGGDEAFNRFEAPYKRQFNEQTVPGLAERFAGLGAMGGGLSSSGFGQALSSAGAGLSENLASLRSGLQGQAAGQATNQYNQLANLGLGAQPFGYERIQGQPGALGQALGIGLGGLTGGMMGGLGGGMGSGFGGGMGNLFKSLFG